jgi:hypothetical protein
MFFRHTHSNTLPPPKSTDKLIVCLAVYFGSLFFVCLAVYFGSLFRAWQFISYAWQFIVAVYCAWQFIVPGSLLCLAVYCAWQFIWQFILGAMMNTEEMLASKDNGTVLSDLGMANMLRTRVRYFTDGAVIGSRIFVNEAFEAARERFSEKRKDGARRIRGIGKAASGALWSARDLRVRL